jgi:hypothetical protein
MAGGKVLFAIKRNSRGSDARNLNAKISGWIGQPG